MAVFKFIWSSCGDTFTASWNFGWLIRSALFLPIAVPPFLEDP